MLTGHKLLTHHLLLLLLLLALLHADQQMTLYLAKGSVTYEL